MLLKVHKMQVWKRITWDLLVRDLKRKTRSYEFFSVSFFTWQTKQEVQRTVHLASSRSSLQPNNNARKFKTACSGKPGKINENGGERKHVKTATENDQHHIRVEHRFLCDRRKVFAPSGGGRGRRPRSLHLREVQVACRGFDVVGWKWRRSKPNKIETWVTLACSLF